MLAGSRFSALETGIQVPLTKNTKPSTWNLESMPWNSESKITIHGARSVLLKGSLCNGGSRGGGAPPLFLDQTEFRKAEKKIFVTGPPPYLRVSMIAPPPPLSYGLDPPLLCPPKRSQKASRLNLLMGQRTPQTTMVTEPYRMILIMFEKRSRKYMRPFIVVH